MTRKSSEQVRDAMKEKSVEELEDLISGLEEEIPERSKGPIKTSVLLKCRKKAIASSVLEEVGPDRKEKSRPNKQGQQNMEAFV